MALQRASWVSLSFDISEPERSVIDPSTVSELPRLDITQDTGRTSCAHTDNVAGPPESLRSLPTSLQLELPAALPVKDRMAAWLQTATCSVTHMVHVIARLDEKQKRRRWCRNFAQRDRASQ